MVAQTNTDQEYTTQGLFDTLMAGMEDMSCGREDHKYVTRAWKIAERLAALLEDGRIDREVADVLVWREDLTLDTLGRLYRAYGSIGQPISGLAVGGLLAHGGRLCIGMVEEVVADLAIG